LSQKASILRKLHIFSFKFSNSLAKILLFSIIRSKFAMFS
jgi:hypothetical protein